MRVSDMCSLPLAALWQQKMRTVLTTMGVVFGSFVLAASLSTNQGVQDAIGREMGEGDMLRRLQIQQQGARGKRRPVVVNGQMSDTRRERLREAIQTRRQMYGEDAPEKVLDQKGLQAIGGLEHVERVIPVAREFGSARIEGHSESSNALGVPLDSTFHSNRVIAGRFFNDAREQSAIVSEFLAYRLGFTDEAAMKGLVGKTLRFEVPHIYGYNAAAAPQGGRNRRNSAAGGRGQMAAQAILAQLPAFLADLGLSPGSRSNSQRSPTAMAPAEADSLVKEFKIVGVTRLPSAKDQERWDALHQDSEILLPLGTAVDLVFQVPREARQGVAATVIVDREENLDEVLARINAMGLQGFAYREGLKRERLMYSLIFRSMTCIAAVALFVAALGIANTMLMSVLERTREIGVMKAVGAGNGQLQLIFLIEGALIGLVGGGVGLLLAFGASFPGDLWVRSMVSRDIKVELKHALFVFPPWLTLTVMIFAVLVTTLAALYPARRAARIDAVSALRHE